jgi:hypothetical protein
MERLFKLIYFAGVLAQIILRMPYERQGRQIPKLTQISPRRRPPIGSGLIWSAERRNGKAEKAGRSQPRRPRLQNGDHTTAPPNPLSYILSTSLIGVGVR